MNQVSQQRKAFWPYPKVLLHAFAVTAMVFVGLSAWAFWSAPASLSSTWDHSLARLTTENGLLENTQVLMLSAAIFLGFFASFRTVRLHREHSTFWSYVAFGIVCVSMIGWVREIQSYSSQSTIQGLTLDRSFKRVITGSAGFAILVSSIVVSFKAKPSLLAHLRVGFLWPLVPFAACFVLAEICEEQQWVVLEETVEVYAYGLLAITNLWILRQTFNPDASIFGARWLEPLSSAPSKKINHSDSLVTQSVPPDTAPIQVASIDTDSTSHDRPIRDAA